MLSSFECSEVCPKQQMQNHLYPVHFSDIYVLLYVRSILSGSQVTEERFPQIMHDNSIKENQGGTIHGKGGL